MKGERVSERKMQGGRGKGERERERESERERERETKAAKCNFGESTNNPTPLLFTSPRRIRSKPNWIPPEQKQRLEQRRS